MAATEQSPLLPTSTSAITGPPKPQRTVTFSPNTTINQPGITSDSTRPLRPAAPSSAVVPAPQGSTGPSGQPKLSVLNSKLRRRNSHGSPIASQPLLSSGQKLGPQRTSKNAQKLKLLPNPDPGEEGPDEESGRDVYSQFTRIKDPTARRDAARLGKADRDKLPRVTAYCTASSYQTDGLMKFLKSRQRTRGTNPKKIDDDIYSTYDYRHSKRDANQSDVGSAAVDIDVMLPDEEGTSKQPLPTSERRHSDSELEIDGNKSQDRSNIFDHSGEDRQALLENGESSRDHLISPNHTSPLISAKDFDTHVQTPEVFFFNYGTVVIWGMTLAQEERLLADISRFEEEKLAPDDVHMEEFNFYYTKEYQARIYNDFISLRDKKHYMTKLAISHALAQSVKTSYYEDLLATAISVTQPLPEQIALTGSINMTGKQIHQQIGKLFTLRIKIYLQGSVLDTPELFWSEPSLEPVYAAVRSYLEMDQRVRLLTDRLSVIGDLLAVLKDQVGTRRGETLEWIGMLLPSSALLRFC